MRNFLLVAGLLLGIARAQQGFDVLQSTSQLSSVALFADYNSLQAFLPALSQDESPSREDLSADFLSNNTIPPHSGTSSSSRNSRFEEEVRHPETTPVASTPSTQPHLQDPKHIFNKRQTTTAYCPRSYSACNDGNIGWCCPTTAACSRDWVGNVGCCNYGAVCTGTIGAPRTSTTTASTTQTTSMVTQSASTTTVAGATQTGAGAGFIMVSGNPVATIGAGGAVSGAAHLEGLVKWLVLSVCGILALILVP
jgi:hypothetical protein